ncbi:MAG: virulence RhuM family protein [Streptococcaceae bacterium]|jgi:hypothetical protein|nr:virulence RhuM family protein [Streptococcaceae bacterium]
MSDNHLPQPTNSQFLIYQTEDGRLKIDVRFDDDTVWLTQDQLVQLFQSSKSNVSEHIKHIFEEGELVEDSVVRHFRTTATDGKTYNKKFYNLDVIISIGYRIKSQIATKFRQWATEHLREFIVKGFMLDDERLKNPDLPFDYFDELLARIQDIRTSERRFYQKITDIYATSIDYDPTEDISILFFQTIQNKLHWAITGQTAAEIIQTRANATKPNMGLTNWRGSNIRKSDIGVAKNYLNQEELSALNDIVEAYLTFAQAQANRRIPMYMKDWIETLDGFLTLSRRDVLEGAGKISHNFAMNHANVEYESFKQIRLQEQDKLPSEFDKLLGGDEK